MINKEDFIIRNENIKSSRKLYACSCDMCFMDRGYQRLDRASAPYCKSCASSITHQNKTVTDLTKAKMSDNNYIKNTGYHPMKGKKHGACTINKLSLAASKQNANYRKDFLYWAGDRVVQMRSGWEVRYAKWLDSQNIAWEYEPAFLLSDGRVYLADFKLNDETIIEIKGYFRPDSKIKWDRFCEEYPGLKKQLLMKTELTKLKII